MGRAVPRAAPPRFSDQFLENRRLRWTVDPGACLRAELSSPGLAGRLSRPSLCIS